MASINPPSPDDASAERPATPAVSAARLRIMQRSLATITHELGNLTSPVALVADAIGASPTAAQQAGAAATLQLVAESLRSTTTICRMLRGNMVPGALSPTTFTDAAHWWSLFRPFVADMLPGTTRIEGSFAPLPLAPTQYEPLVWATMAAAMLAATTRPALSTLTVSGEAAADDEPALVVRLLTRAPRATPIPPIAREFRQLAEWEAARVGGRVSITNMSSRLEIRITMPPPPG